MSFDIAVVGGGIVGIAIARQLLLNGCSVVLFERESDVLLGASGANSSLLHCGFDASPELLEARLVKEGFALWLPFCEQLGIVQKTGGLVVAYTEAERALLPKLLEQARLNGCDDVELLDEVSLYAKHGAVLAPGGKGALYVPREYVADSWIAGLFLFGQCLDLGLVLRLNTEVVSVQERGDLLLINNEWLAKTVVNAAGVNADKVERLRPKGPLTTLESRPRLGQFAVLECNRKFDGLPIIYPVPNERTKGVLVWQNLGGHLVVGPTAEDVSDRSPPASVPVSVARQLEGIARARLRDGESAICMPAVLTYSGLRPGSQERDYVVAVERDWATAAGVRSTGFSSALALAALLARRARPHLRNAEPSDPRWRAWPRSWPALLARHRPHPQTALRLAKL